MAYDLRIGLFPVAFQAGSSQSWFGSGLRAEYGVHPRFDLGVTGRVPWGLVAGQHGVQAYAFGVGFVLHFRQVLERESLSGTVYPENPPIITGPGPGTDHDLELPVNQRLGDPPIVLDHPTGEAVMRRVYSLRFGAQYARNVSGRPQGQPVLNRMAVVHLGFGWGTHWNVDRHVTGKAEIGFRRYYIDALGTPPALSKYRALDEDLPARIDLFPVGLRIGMEGSIDAFYEAVPGFGFAYSLELGLLPGRPGPDGYLFLGLGIALDAATR